MYWEDEDLCYKLAPRFGRIIVVPDAVYRHDWEKRRGYVAQHRMARNYLVVMKRHRSADPVRMIRDAIYGLRRRQWLAASARISGAADYLLRARRWA